MPEIEFVTIANHIESLNGLLYVSGGGWTDHWRPPQKGGGQFISHLGIGVSILVAWTETNIQHQLVLTLETEDGKPVFEVRPILNMGRPFNLPPGSDQRAVFAVNVEINFPQDGGYRILSRIEGAQGSRSVTFRVHDVPQGGAGMGPLMVPPAAS
jgi:hypothetical protein